MNFWKLNVPASKIYLHFLSFPKLFLKIKNWSPPDLTTISYFQMAKSLFKENWFFYLRTWRSSIFLPTAADSGASSLSQSGSWVVQGAGQGWVQGAGQGWAQWVGQCTAWHLTTTRPGGVSVPIKVWTQKSSTFSRTFPEEFFESLQHLCGKFRLSLNLLLFVLWHEKMWRFFL